MDDPAVVELLAGVAAAVSRRAAAVSEDVYEVILREIPELRDDKPVLAEESLGRPVGENRHGVELALRISHWLGSSVLQPTRERSAAPTGAA